MLSFPCSVGALAIQRSPPAWAGSAGGPARPAPLWERRCHAWPARSAPHWERRNQAYGAPPRRLAALARQTGQVRRSAPRGHSCDHEALCRVLSHRVVTTPWGDWTLRRAVRLRLESSAGAMIASCTYRGLLGLMWSLTRNPSRDLEASSADAPSRGGPTRRSGAASGPASPAPAAGAGAPAPRRAWRCRGDAAGMSWPAASLGPRPAPGRAGSCRGKGCCGAGPH